MGQMQENANIKKRSSAQFRAHKKRRALDGVKASFSEVFRQKRGKGKIPLRRNQIPSSRVGYFPYPTLCGKSDAPLSGRRGTKFDAPFKGTEISGILIPPTLLGSARLTRF